MRVIRCGQKAEPSKAMTDMEVLGGFWHLEEQLGIRERPTAEKLLNIPRLDPIPLPQEKENSDES